MILISACIIVKNEENNIGRCLDSIRDVTDEIIIVDESSTDNTVKICQNYTDQIFNFEWTGSFADKRNYASEKARNEWILVIDADEFLTEDSKNEIRQIRDESNFSAFTIRRLSYIFGKYMWEENMTRLYKKSRSQWRGKVHAWR